MQPDVTDLADLLGRAVPLLDVRAPVEFRAGAIPGAVNLPLMDDEERRRVGLCYKQHGPEAALALGHRLVSGDLREARVAAWVDFVRAHPDAVVMCFRGGQRSGIARQWLAEAGYSIPRVAGGYKALRSFLLDTHERVAAQCGFTVLGGLTGTGKTELLAEVVQAVDLEAHAAHRGSSFGRRLCKQPGQVDFENALAADFLRRRAQGLNHFVVEDESRFIGQRHLPRSLHLRMQSAPLVWLEASLEERIARIRKDYVLDILNELLDTHDEVTAWAQLSEMLISSLARIARRLGGARHAEAAALMAGALEQHQKHGDTQAHDAWIALLLKHYYDPMYASQRAARDSRVVFRGPRAAVLAWLRAQLPARDQDGKLAVSRSDA